MQKKNPKWSVERFDVIDKGKKIDNQHSGSHNMGIKIKRQRWPGVNVIKDTATKEIWQTEEYQWGTHKNKKAEDKDTCNTKPCNNWMLEQTQTEKEWVVLQWGDKGIGRTMKGSSRKKNIDIQQKTLFEYTNTKLVLLVCDCEVLIINTLIKVEKSFDGWRKAKAGRQKDYFMLTEHRLYWVLCMSASEVGEVFFFFFVSTPLAWHHGRSWLRDWFLAWAPSHQIQSEGEDTKQVNL